jgi:hypothetical protein
MYPLPWGLNRMKVFGLFSLTVKHLQKYFERKGLEKNSRKAKNNKQKLKYLTVFFM